MRLTSYFLLCIFILFFSFLSSDVPQANERDLAKLEEKTQVNNFMLWTKLIQKIEKDNCELKNIAIMMSDPQYAKKDPHDDAKKMAKFLGENVTVVTSQGAAYHGPEGFAEFWGNVCRNFKSKKKKVVDFKTKIISIRISEVKEEDPSKKDEEQITHIAYIISKYSYITETIEGTLKNESFEAQSSRRHPKLCNW